MVLGTCQSQSDSDVNGSPSRSLSLFNRFPLHKRIAAALLSGDIDRAAELVANAVRSGNGAAIVKGFLQAQTSRNDFSIVQTIVRALGLGVDKEDLRKAVEEGGENEPNSEEVVQEIIVVLAGASPPPPPPPPPAPPPPPPPPQPVQYFVQRTTPVHQQQIVVGVPGGSPHLVQSPATVPTPGVPQITVMVDPMDSTGVFFEQQAVRLCRGTKEEQCCKEYTPYSTGCSCDFNNDCRFKFISRNPVIMQDTRRPGGALWTCLCDNG